MRRLLRALALGALLLAVAFGALLLTLQSHGFEQRLRALAESEARARLGPEVSIRSLEVEPLRLRAHLVRVHAPAAPGRPALSAERVTVRLGAATLLGRAPHLVVRVEGLEVELGRLDPAAPLGRAWSIPGTTPAAAATLDRVELSRARVTLELGHLRAAIGPLDGRIERRRAGARATLSMGIDALSWAGRPLGPGDARLELEVSDSGEIRLEQASGRLASGSFELHGRLLPELDLTSRITLDGATLAAQLGRPGAAAGEARLAGRLSGMLAAPASGAPVPLRWRGTVTARRMWLAGRLPIDDLVGTLVVGRLAAELIDATARPWGGSARFTARLPLDRPPVLTASFRAEGVDIDRVDENLPLPGRGGQAAAEGEVEVRQRTGARIGARVRFTGFVPDRPAAADHDPRLAQLLAPLDGSFDLSFAEGSFRLGGLRAANSLVEIDGEVSGDVTDAVRGAARVTIADLSPIAWLEPGTLPWAAEAPRYRLLGSFAGQMVLDGRPADRRLRIDGRIAEARAQRAADPSELPLGPLSVALELSSRGLGFRASGGAPVRLGLDGYQRFGPGDTTDLSLEAGRLDAGLVGRLLRLPFPAEGPVDVHLRLAGPTARPGIALAVAGEVGVGGLPAGPLRLDLEADDAGYRIHRLEARSGTSRVSLSGSLRRATAGRPGGGISLEVQAEEVPIARLLGDRAGSTRGRLSLDGRFGGTIDHPAGVGRVLIEDLETAQACLGEVAGAFALNGRQLDLDLTHVSRVALHLGVSLRSPYPMSASLELADFPLETLAGSTASRPVGLRGRLSATVEASGELASPRPLGQLLLRGQRLSISLPGLEATTPAPFTAELRPDRQSLKVAGLRLEGDGLDLAVDGVVGLAGASWDLGLNGSADLRIARAFFPDLVLSGPVALAARLGGPTSALGLYGGATLRDGYLRARELPFPVRDISGAARLEGRSLRADDLRGRFGGSPVRADLRVDLGGADATALEARVVGTDLRLPLSNEIELRADSDLTVRITPSERRLSGSVQVTRGLYRLGSSGRNPLGSLAGPLAGEIEAPAVPTWLDLDLVAPDNLWLVAEGLRVEGEGRLHVGGSLAEPQLLGALRFLSQERVHLRRRDWTVLRASLTFDNPSAIEPRLDLEAEAAIQSYTVSLLAQGPLRSARITARSEPPLPEADVLALILGGQVGAAASGVQQDFLRSFVLPAATSSLGGARVSVDYAALRGKARPTEVVPLLIEVRRDVGIVVGIPLRESQRSQLVALDWRPRPSFLLSAIHDLDQSYGAEAYLNGRFGPEGRAAGLHPRLASVAVSGIDGALGERARQALKLRPGTLFSLELSRQDVERLYQLLREAGHPLARVSASTAPAPAGAYDLLYTVEPGPAVAVTIDGPEPDRRLRERLSETVATFGLYDETVDALERTLRRSWAERGHSQALASCTAPAGGTTADFACEVDPGPHLRVRRIEIEGNQAISSRSLRQVISTRGSFLRAPRLVPEQAADDAQAIEAAYRSAGYLAARARAEIRQTDRPDQLDLVFHLTEGPLYRVATIRIEGSNEVPAGELLAEVRLRPGDPVEDEALRRAREAIFARLDRQGRMGSEVRTELRPGSQPATVEVVYRVTEGAVLAVGPIEVTGLRRTHRGVVERALGMGPGDPLSYESLAEAQRRIYDLGSFRSAEVQAVSDGPIRPLRVRVEEARPYRMLLGGGFNSREGLRGSFDLTDLNFLGAARSASIALRGSPSAAHAELRYREPMPLGRRAPTQITAFADRRDEVSFAVDELAARIETAFPFGRGDRERVLVGYELADTNLRGVEVSPIEAGAEELKLSGVNGAILLDRRDDLLAPRAGFLAAADGYWSAAGLGSEASFVRVALRAFAYRELSRRLVFAGGGQLGLGFPYGPTDRLPLAKRFFLGGSSTLRGLGYNQAGPRDAETDEPTGGDAALAVNQELRLDLVPGLVGTVFVDVGNVYRRRDDLSLSDLRYSAGIGLRYGGAVLAGLDYARLLDAEAGEPPYRVHFSLGFAF